MWALSAVPYATTWQTSLVVLAVPLLAWARQVVSAWQEHRTVKMILTSGGPGSLVISQARRRRSTSTLLVLVGELDTKQGRQLLERWST